MATMGESARKRTGKGKTSSRVREPAKVATEVMTFLEAEADVARAKSSQRFFKGEVALFGVPAAAQRKFAKSLVQRLKADWSWSQAVRLADILIKDPHLEAKSVGLLVLGEFRDDFPVNLLPRLKSWLAWHSGNWATVDLLAPDLLGALLDRHPDLITDVESWTESRSLWVRRGAAVAFVKHARKGKHLGVVYRIARRLLDDEEDLMHKAVGWLLREAGKTDRERLERFLLKHGPRIPRTTLRYAIERFPARDRKRLLAVTKG